MKTMSLFAMVVLAGSCHSGHCGLTENRGPDDYGAFVKSSGSSNAGGGASPAAAEDPKGSVDAGVASKRHVPADCEVLDVEDLAHVDPQELLGQAKRMAQKIDRHAVFQGINVHGLVAGTVDSRLEAGDITVTFRYMYVDTEGPPGRDVVGGSIWIRTRVGLLCTEEHSLGGSSPVHELPEPRCSVKKAWAAVVASGVPSNAVANVLYGSDFTIFRSDPPPLRWRFRVDGHDEFDRKVDGATCLAQKTR